MLGRLGGDGRRDGPRRLLARTPRQAQVRPDLAGLLPDDDREDGGGAEDARRPGERARLQRRRVGGERGALRLEQAAPPPHVRVLDRREPLEEYSPGRVTFVTGEQTVQPRGVHLVSVILGPDRIDSHDGMLSISQGLCP